MAETVNPVAPAAACGCGKAFADGEARYQVALRDGTLRAACELCHLRWFKSVTADQVRRLTGLLGGVLVKLGGAARIHRQDIARAFAAGGFQSAEEEEGGFIVLRVDEPAIVVTGAMPPGPGSG